MSLPLGDGEPVTLRWFDGTTDPLPNDDSGVAEVAVQRDGVVHHIGQVLWERNDDNTVTLASVLNDEGRAMRDGNQP